MGDEQIYKIEICNFRKLKFVIFVNLILQKKGEPCKIYLFLDKHSVFTLIFLTVYLLVLKYTVNVWFDVYNLVNYSMPNLFMLLLRNN